MILERIGSQSCLKCEVQSNQLGQNSHAVYQVRAYPIYQANPRQVEFGAAASSREYFQQVGVNIRRNLLMVMYPLNLSDLHKPHLLYSSYLGLLKHRIHGVERFVKKINLPQACYKSCSDIPPCPKYKRRKNLSENSHKGME